MSSYLLDKELPARVADVLRFAAAPTFVVLALLGGFPQDQPQTAFCASITGGSPLGGMSFMYLLMACFHAIPPRGDPPVMLAQNAVWG
jgi:hypothetical protein